MLELKNITKSYDSPGQAESVTVLKDISLKLRQAQSMSIVGPSGCGKSTLLNIIGALDKPTSGRIVFDGQDLAGLNESQLARIRNTEIGFIFQLHHLLPQCTVIENVLIPTLASKNGSSKEQTQARAVELLERVGLGDFMQHRPGELSGGQRQRVAVVRALINKPKLLLADEPTGSLDSESSQMVGQLLVELNKSQQVTLIVVTHSFKLAELTERACELSDGVLKDRSKK